ncbi:MAG: L,D-transpeptidase [Syntrophobacteraceae bacterium]
MKKVLRRAILFGVLGAVLSGFLSACIAHAASIDDRLYSELLQFKTDGKVVEVDGVPCLKIFLQQGQSISHFCRFVPYFDHNFKFYRQRIALINRLEFMAVVDSTDDLSTSQTSIFVPLNFSIRPQILPERIENISNLPKYILVDLGKQCLGLYEYGALIHQFPACSGAQGTPARKFTILSKEKDHYSTQYSNAWMPYALRLFGNYYLHAGILPGYAASHGCIRLIYENAVFVYDWAEVGTPGEVVEDASGTKEIAPPPEEAEEGVNLKSKPAPASKLPPTHSLGGSYRNLFAPDF